MGSQTSHIAIRDCESSMHGLRNDQGEEAATLWAFATMPWSAVPVSEVNAMMAARTEIVPGRILRSLV